MSEIKPCPFCGERHNHGTTELDGTFSIGHVKMEHRVTVNGETRKDAEGKWNTLPRAADFAAGPWRPIAQLPDGLPSILLQHSDGGVVAAQWWVAGAGPQYTIRQPIEKNISTHVSAFLEDYTHYAEIRRLEHV